MPLILMQMVMGHDWMAPRPCSEYGNERLEPEPKVRHEPSPSVRGRGSSAARQQVRYAAPLRNGCANTGRRRRAVQLEAGALDTIMDRLSSCCAGRIVTDRLRRINHRYNLT